MFHGLRNEKLRDTIKKVPNVKGWIVKRPTILCVKCPNTLIDYTPLFRLKEDFNAHSDFRVATHYFPLS